MALTRLDGESFRLFESFALEPDPGLNLLIGDNAAGKTSLLEAVFVLGRGRGFRATPPELLRETAKSWRVSGQFATARGEAIPLGVQWADGELTPRFNRADATLSEMIRHFPVQVLEPDSHRLLEDGPAHRRRYLDWGVFHVEHRFFPAWRRFLRAMRQRNQALRARRPREECEAWNPELAAAGEEVHALRTAQLERLRPVVGAELERLLGGAPWSLDLHSGWSAGQGLAESLAEHFEQDLRQGKTLSGPHRAELRLKLSGHRAKRRVSRGQQKLLIAALLLAQARLIAQHADTAPVLLVDDFPAELGASYQAALLAALRDYPGQVFVSAIAPTQALKATPPGAVFHVEHGAVTRGKLV